MCLAVSTSFFQMITRIWVLSWVCYCNAIARRPHIYSASRLRHPGICCTGLAWHHLTTIWLASFQDIYRKAITNIGSQHPVAQGLSVRMFERLHWRKRAGSTWREITWPMRNLRHYREALKFGDNLYPFAVCLEMPGSSFWILWLHYEKNVLLCQQ